MIWSKSEMLAMVLEHCDGTDPALACSIIHAMSQWIPATVNALEPETDATYGLFQFSGQQARQAGYKGELKNLIDAQLNIELGTQLLRESLEKANNRAEAALLSFLGRSRAQMIPGIVAMIPQYERLIGSMPVRIS